MQKAAKLSKSRKRQLEKIKEDKERAILYKKSIEHLEKYKIPESAIQLLKSSNHIGQNETALAKRRKVVEYSKAGLDVPDCDQSYVTNCSKLAVVETSDSDKEFDEDKLVQSIIEKRVYVDESFNACNSTFLAKEDSLDSSTFCGKKGLKEMDGLAKNEKVDNISTAEKLSGCPFYKSLNTSIVVPVSRPSEVNENRKDLPIVMMEQEIMEAINGHPVVIICGETGCGKTTQVPQFLYEAGYGSDKTVVRSGIIGVTQPRRVAVLATAKRVAFELGFHLGKQVGFQVRYDKKLGNSCSIKFMTDGILLREVQSDFLLRRYSVIILDEAHERSWNTDILIGMLSGIIQERQRLFEEQQQDIHFGRQLNREDMVFPLKVVLMSATLRVEDFILGKNNLQPTPPVIEVPARQYSVTTYFSKKTEIVDYIGKAYNKVLNIHKRLPDGGILVFVTGKQEVEYLCQKLREASKELIKNTRGNIGTEVTNVAEIKSVGGTDINEIKEAFDDPSDFYNDHSVIDEGFDELDILDDFESDSELEFVDDTLNDKTLTSDGTQVDVFLKEDGSLDSLKAAFEALAGKSTTNYSVMIDEIQSGNSTVLKEHSDVKEQFVRPLHVLPLYAMLPSEAQMLVFEDVNKGERLVVVTTNVAETSLTIPGIKYVVDTGREKVKNYNTSNGMETFEVQWISKASAAQRAGRAGRTGPGHCYRLYSSAAFSNEFPDFAHPEISKMPVDGIVLLLKSMHIKVSCFPFPTPPLATALVDAERCLKALEAFDINGGLTSLGKAMSKYPMSPRHARMLLIVIQILNEYSQKSNIAQIKRIKEYPRADLVLGYAVACAAALSFFNPFSTQFEVKTDKCDPNHISEKMMNAEEILRIKKLKEASKMARAKFYNPSSDALTIAYALQCFEHSGSPVDFCKENGLHYKTMDDISKLRKQLLRLVVKQNHDNDFPHEFSWAHGDTKDVESAWGFPSEKIIPLLPLEQEILCRAICAGWADRIARRMSSRSSEGDRISNASRYQSSAVRETVFLHRRSSLSSSAPEFLVYNELLRTKRPYMHGATSVKPEWIVKYAGSLCSFSKPITDSNNCYMNRTDQVFCRVTPIFGPHLWQLPLQNLPIEDKMDRVSVFAFALLDGKVLPCLRSERKYMAASPGALLKRESYGTKRVGNLINRLNSGEVSIDSCIKLRKALENDWMFLHSEVLDWFQEGYRGRFEKIWKDIHREVVLNPKQRFPRTKKNA